MTTFRRLYYDTIDGDYYYDTIDENYYYMAILTDFICYIDSSGGMMYEVLSIDSKHTPNASLSRELCRENPHVQALYNIWMLHVGFVLVGALVWDSYKAGQ